MNITTTTKLVESRINVNGNVQFENIYEPYYHNKCKAANARFNLNEMTCELTSKVWIFTLRI